jgi:type I restriction enzyme S subunit
MEVKQNIPKGYKQTEVGVIPEDWGVISIGDEFEFKNGLNKGKEYFGFGTPIVNYMDVFKYPGLRRENIHGLVSVNAEEQRNYSVKKGDVFFTRTSETLEEVGIASVLIERIEHAVFSGFILRARPMSNMFDILYCIYCFSPQFVRKQITSKGSYTTRALTNGGSLSRVIIPLPPLPEQKAIAKVLGDTDSLIESLTALIDKKKAIKQGAMQELLTGKRRLPGFAKSDKYKQTEVGVIPEDWGVILLGNIAQIYRGASPRPIDDPKWFDFRSTIGWVRISDVTQSKKFLLGTDQRLSEEGKKQSRFVASNNLIMSICATVGRPIITKIDTCIHDGFVVFQNLHADSIYIYYVLTSVEHDWSASGQTGSQMNLNTSIIQSKLIPLPPLPEQKAIAQVLSDMDTEIEALEQKRDKYKQIKQGMMEQLLTGKVRLL